MPHTSEESIRPERRTFASAITPAEAREIAKEVFLWGMHPVGIYHLRYNFAQNEKSPTYCGLNRVFWHRTPMKALPREGTTPNATTLYALGMLDLAREPVVVTVDETHDRYWSIQFHDNYARWWHMIGSQFSAPGPVRRLLIGPDWKGTFPPEFVGADIVQSPSNFAGVTGRVALTDDTADELASVHAFQDGVTVMTLSQWIAAGRRTVKADDVPLTRAAYPTYPGMEKVKEPGHLAGLEFLRWIGLILSDPSFTKQTDSHHEVTAFERFEQLGLKVGSTFDPDRLAPAIVSAVEAGVEDGRKAVLALNTSNSDVKRNGWEFVNDLGYHDSDWLQRARNGLIALLAPVPARSHTGAFCFDDSEGRPLTGEHRYTITFDLDNLPPVTEFWEIPLYDREGYFVDNPLNRYSLNSYMLQRGKLHTAQGKLVIYVQAEAPADPEQRRNWLPAPHDGFQFAARFYGPHGPLIDGDYDMPGVVRA